MISNIIARSSTSKKVIDFRDGLVLANPEDYAMIFGVGGGKHAAVSVVKVTICDFSEGTGDKSTTANANLELETISLLRAVAEQKLLNPVKSPALAQTQPSVQTKAESGILLDDAAWASFMAGFKQVGDAAKARRGLSYDELLQLGSNLRAVRDAGKKPKETTVANQPAVSPGIADFTHSQVRINIYKKGSGGLPADFAPVSRLTITHTPLDKNGRVNNYPWVVKITNGSARVVEASNGATSYASNTYQETQSVFMNLSDLDWFRMMEACRRYIDTFTMCFGIPLVKNGVNQRLSDLADWKNSMT